MKNIIFDLDGTILESDNSLSKETIECIKKVSKNNIVTIATGRSLTGLPNSVLDIENFINYYITSNGTTIYDINKEVVYRDVIQSADIKTFLFSILNNSDLVVEVLSDGNWHIDETAIKGFKRVDIKSAVMDYIFRTRINHQCLVKYLLDNNIEIEKITINLCSPISEQLKSSIYELCDKYGLRCFSEHPHKIDVFKKTTNKGTAISFLSKYCGVGLNDTISFGNDENDIEMFEVSSISICMPNSTKNAKKCSDIVLKINDNKRIKRAFKALKSKGISFVK